MSDEQMNGEELLTPDQQAEYIFMKEATRLLEEEASGRVADIARIAADAGWDLDPGSAVRAVALDLLLWAQVGAEEDADEEARARLKANGPQRILSMAKSGEGAGFYASLEQIWRDTPA